MSDEQKKILIVEDEADTAYILGLLLKKNNFISKIAKNGQEALEILENFTPEVIIADWNMPIMNGIELCEKVKSSDKYKLIYFIILTARSTLQDRVKGLDVGADDFLLKPIENQELLARIRTGMRIHNLQNELRQIEHSKALIEMATTIGHNINNPLSSLLLSLENIKAELKENKLIASISEDVNIIEESLKKIQILAKDLTNLQRPELIQYAENKSMLNFKD
ncbi:MAG: response regulator [Melioribacteraceae bacterium]|nr:response regulator [Melioribacteraceae bacterium]RJP63145.1 MAG: DNA-binding response regulator [Ignavibacteriales bacterium]WKZ70135.1 MAG: response regulator [Melioribacteraceae bacterium]